MILLRVLRNTVVKVRPNEPAVILLQQLPSKDSKRWKSGVVTQEIKLAERITNLSPKIIQPYMRLARYHRPRGSWLLFWPCSWGIASAAAPGCMPDLYMMALFGTGSLIMRGAGCTINDMWDRDIDGKVERTKDRPLVNGELTINQAWMFLAGQLTVGLGILLQLNWYSVLLGASSLGLVCVYPLMKRVTHWPQLTLGFTYNWGCLLGYSAVQGHVDTATCLPLYFSAICWTLIYDTIYAHQDKIYDLELGMKSTAIKFGDNTKTWLTGFSTMMISSLALSGYMNGQTFPYYISIGLIAAHLAKQINTLNIDSPQDCGDKFRSNSQVGALLLGGIILGTLLKDKRKKEKSSVEL